MNRRLGRTRTHSFLETHSEHLILRILRRVRETTEGKLPAGSTPVRPEDVSVVFVEPTAKGSVVRDLPVTPDGDFGGALAGRVLCRAVPGLAMSLIKEFTIEPRVMATWAHFNSMWEDFGASQGRLISKYPVMWKSQVDELAKKHSKPVQATAISAKMRRDDYKFLVTGRTYRGGQSWLENALSHTATQPFHAVIAAENGAGAKGVLVAGEFAKDEPPYKVGPEDFIPRSAKDLAACAAVLLANCEQVQFVDPHFNPSEPRFRNTFEAMLQMYDANCLKAIEDSPREARSVHR